MLNPLSHIWSTPLVSANDLTYHFERCIDRPIYLRIGFRAALRVWRFLRREEGKQVYQRCYWPELEIAVSDPPSRHEVHIHTPFFFFSQFVMAKKECNVVIPPSESLSSPQPISIDALRSFQTHWGLTWSGFRIRPWAPSTSKGNGVAYRAYHLI